MEPKEVTYEAEVIEDARTGEEIPVGIQKVQSNTLATSLDLTKVGTTVLDEKAEAVLSEPLDPAQVQIRPDGLLYLPWTWYADRLNRAFGRLGWGLIPQSGPQSREEGSAVLVVWGHWLIVRGTPVGFEVGGCSYFPSNHTMSFDDAAAGAKSNSLARNCKMLGMSLELWNQAWIEDWKSKYAESYPNPNQNAKQKRLWRKKTVNGHRPQQKVVDATTQKEVVMTAVGYVDKKVWDEHAEQIAKENHQEVEASGLVGSTKEEKVEFKLSELRNFNKVKEIAKLAGVKNSDVTDVLGKLSEKSSYSVVQVVNMIKGN